MKVRVSFGVSAAGSSKSSALHPSLFQTTSDGTSELLRLLELNIHEGREETRSEVRERTGSDMGDGYHANVPVPSQKKERMKGK